MNKDRANKLVFYYGLGCFGFLIFVILLLFPKECVRILPILFLTLTTLLTFFSLKYGYYGLFYLLMVLIPFSQSVTVFSLGNRQVNLGMHTIVIGWILLFTLILKKFKIPKYTELSTLFLIILGAWTGITILISGFRSINPTISNSIITWIRWIQFIPIVYLLVEDDNIQIHIKKFVKIFIIIGFFVAIWGIIETLYPSEFASRAFRGAVTFTRPLFRETDLSNSFTKNGWYFGSANYNIAGAFMSIITMISIPFLRNRPVFGSNLLSYFLIILLIIGIGVTKSRSAILAFVVGIFYYGYSTSPKRFMNISLLLIVILAILFLYFKKFWLMPIIIETIHKLPEAVKAVLNNQPYNESMGFTVNVYGAAMRFAGIRESIIGFLHYPIFGCGFFGFSNIAKFGTAENFYMQMLCETGAIGFILLFSYLIKIWSYTKTRFPKNSFSYDYQSGFRGALVIFIMVNLTGTLFYDTRIWGLMLILSAIQVNLVKFRYEWET